MVSDPGIIPARQDDPAETAVIMRSRQDVAPAAALHHRHVEGIPPVLAGRRRRRSAPVGTAVRTHRPHRLRRPLHVFSRRREEGGEEDGEEVEEGEIKLESE